MRNPFQKSVGRKLIAVALVALWLLVLGSAAGAIYSKHRARELFVTLERLNNQRDTLEVEWGQLQLEQSAWSTHAFVERVASTKLKMASPRPKDIELISP
jgi:cell division protein FtsL